MKRYLVLLIVLLFGSAAARAQEPLTNDSIAKMVKAGVAENIILSAVKSQPARYDLSPDGLIALKNAGVPDKVVAAMQEKVNSATSTGRRYEDVRLHRTRNVEWATFGDIQIRLKKADAKHNKYTVEVLLDGKLLEKKDKNVNEPVEFYAARSRQPYELVITEVQHDQIVGYIAVPIGNTAEIRSAKGSTKKKAVEEPAEAPAVRCPACPQCSSPSDSWTCFACCDK